MPKNNPNHVCGRPLEFGDWEQIRECKKLQEEYAVWDQVMLLFPSMMIDCPKCRKPIHVDEELFPSIFNP